MQKLSQEDVIQWLENHLLDFEQFTPYLFTSQWIHSFCKDKENGFEFEVKWDTYGQDLFMRLLDNLDSDGQWKWLGTINQAGEVKS
ncbi:hypothetical protein [Fictibacillus barbaricus]|jgi:hypothetical protein|uniref:Uncharacterized protein n=1 Tax=Fictibacillus barbaricus TaxID=182136 RepID=A0ABU1TX68_9BACL|nr:hypothetical protein [Fictibacillus barbaricus]MDR7071809.1 hypothetical protein [Fictibacillus barbaricus]